MWQFSHLFCFLYHRTLVVYHVGNVEVEHVVTHSQLTLLLLRMELRSVPENIAMAFNPLQPVKINSVTGAPMHSSRATHYSSHSTASRLKAWLRMNKAKNHLDPRKK